MRKSSFLIRYLCTQSRDRTGMEVNPLVFETSASTNSAIWAFAKPSLSFAAAKVQQIFVLQNFFEIFF